MGSLWVLWFPPTIQMHAVIRVRLTGASKLAADESVSANGCLSLSVTPATEW